MPLLALVIHDPCRLARAIWISMFNRDEVFVLQRRGASKGKRRSLNWPIQRPPYIYDAEAALKKLLGLVWEVQVYSSCGGFDGLVDVNTGDGCTGGVGVGASDGVVEEENPVAAWDIVED